MSITYSAVIPVFNEERNIAALTTSLISVLGSLRSPYEILFVDDGSIDHTFAEIQRMHSLYQQVRCIQFRKNYGQTAAIRAGFEHAQGDIIITLDGDLQNDPADIPRLISKLNQGFDVVSGWRYPRRDSI